MIDEAQSAPVHDRERLLAPAFLDAGRSLQALGRAGEAKEAFQTARDHFGAHVEGAVASVILQQEPEGLAAYRGKYASDSAHEARVRRLLARAPELLARAAQAVGREAPPTVLVGVADAFAGSGPAGAITFGDARRLGRRIGDQPMRDACGSSSRVCAAACRGRRLSARRRASIRSLGAVGW